MRYEARDADTSEGEGEGEGESSAASAPPPTLSAMSFTLGLVLLLAVFLFLNPIWAAADMTEWNQNIWWSYAPIPLVVAVLLRIEGKLGGASLLLESLKLTLVKFTLTFVIAQVVWLAQGVPGTGLPVAGPVAVDADPERYTVRPAPPATELPAATLGRIAGRLTTAAGEPLADALVWISGGLEQHVFPAPAEAAVLENSGAGFQPELLILRTFQPLTLANHAEQLHTAVIADAAGKRLLNYPVIPGGQRTLMFDREVGLVHLHCSGHGASEPAASLLVVGSPFAARTGPDGTYSFEGVPAGNLRVTVRGPQGLGHHDLAVSPGQTASGDLQAR